jgi:hypothetical protein
MATKRHLFLILAVPVLLIAGGLSAAAAQDARDGRDVPTDTADTTPTGPGTRALPPDVVPATTFVPVTPCRIVDTRSAGGPLAPNAVRDFYVAGKTGFASQGGSGTCGIPEHATAVAATFTAVGPDGNGFVRAWPVDEPAPVATLLNYQRTSGGIGTGATVAITPGSGKDLRVRNLNATTHLVVDVAGYYASPLWATVSSVGNLINSSGAVIGSSRTATGSYAIDFDVPVKGCAVSVTPTSTFMNVGANNPTGTTDRVAVFLRDIELHTLGNSQFTIVVTC